MSATLAVVVLSPAGGKRLVAQSELVYQPRVVVNREFKPLVDPPIVAADQANVLPDELVIGVHINGEARAYPINQLTGPSREIINDQLGGIAIAATW